MVFDDESEKLENAPVYQQKEQLVQKLLEKYLHIWQTGFPWCDGQNGRPTILEVVEQMKPYLSVYDEEGSKKYFEKCLIQLGLCHQLAWQREQERANFNPKESNQLSELPAEVTTKALCICKSNDAGAYQKASDYVRHYKRTGEY